MILSPFINCVHKENYFFRRSTSYECCAKIVMTSRVKNLRNFHSRRLCKKYGCVLEFGKVGKRNLYIYKWKEGCQHRKGSDHRLG